MYFSTDLHIHVSSVLTSSFLLQCLSERSNNDFHTAFSTYSDRNDEKRKEIGTELFTAKDKVEEVTDL